MPASARIHEDEASVDYWWGTLADVVHVLRRAGDAMHEKAAGANVAAHISVAYVNGSQGFDNIDDFTKAVETNAVDPAEVEHVYFQAEPTAAGPDSLTVSFYGDLGVTVSARSTDEVWVEGVVAVLRDLLRRDEQPSRQPGYKRPGWFEMGAAAVSVLAILVLAGIASSFDYGLGGWIIFALLLLGLLLVTWPLVMERNETERFRVLAAPLSTSKTKEPWSVKIDRFVRARPALNLLVGFALGVVTNKVSDWL